MTKMHPILQDVLNRVIERSKPTRKAYLEQIDMMRHSSDGDRRQISCSNMAHAAAGAGQIKALCLEQRAI